MVKGKTADAYLQNELDLYEAQSSWRPNMPLRGLIYFSNLYQGYVARHGLDIHSSRLIPLPRPVYMVFYNGTKERGEREVLRLSEAFEGRKAMDAWEEETLQVVVKVWNINYGHNKELMEHCRRLHDYAYLVEQIRVRRKQGETLSEAVDHAVSDCIKNNILKDFLLEHRGEMRNVLLTEYDEELHIRSEKQLSYEEGMERGIEALVLDNEEEGVTPERIVKKLQKRFSLTKEQATGYLKKFSAARTVP